MDPNFVSSNERDISYVASKFCIKAETVRHVKFLERGNRQKIYAALRTEIKSASIYKKTNNNHVWN